MARFVRNAAGIKFVLKDLNGHTGNHIRDLSQRTTALSKTRVGVDTGQLRDSINYSVFLRGHIIGRIGSNNKIAYLHHEGTQPHMIYPKKRKSLKFSRGTKTVFAKAVMHPGTKPNRYLTSSLADVVGKS